MQYLIFLGAVDTDVFGSTKIANLRIKVIEANVIGWLQKESINKNNKRWTIWKRASFFLLLYSAMPQRTLYSCLQRYKFFTRRYADFKKFIENFTVWNLKSATKPLNVLIAFTRPLITEFADNLNLKHPLLPTISPYPTMRLEAIRSIIPISYRRYPKSVWNTSA